MTCFFWHLALRKITMMRKKDGIFQSWILLVVVFPWSHWFQEKIMAHGISWPELEISGSFWFNLSLEAQIQDGQACKDIEL